jgi:hypothetical protein
VSDEFFGGFSAHGRVPCLSLWITIKDLDDRELFFGTGGIEVVAKLHSDFFREKFQPVDDDAVLRDAARNRQAIRNALGPAIGAPTHDPTPTPVRANLDARLGRSRAPTAEPAPI